MNIRLTLISLIFTLRAFGQQAIYGKVTDQSDTPLPNASVFISESQTGTTADASGNFKLTIPKGSSFKLVASHIGYQTDIKLLNAASIPANINFVLKPISRQLQEVVVRSDNDWKHWGAIFTDAFIGKSAFAAHCTIVNKDVIGFDFDDATKALHAYAVEPITVNNDDLGYTITLTLADFTLDTLSKDVDYLAYYLFKEMQGDARRQAHWQQNRLKAYSLSFMHFTRALCSHKLKEEGYEVRQMIVKENTEKQRIKTIYQRRLDLYEDSVSNTKHDVNYLVEHSFNNDSLKYYKKILSQKSSEIKIGEPLGFKDIATQKDSNTILLNFKDVLQVAYKKTKEPDEFYNYKNQIALATENTSVLSTGISSTQLVYPVKEYPFTELWLLKGMPVEIASAGYINNTNLYMKGFWGWWEKIATRLPYEYEPE